MEEVFCKNGGFWLKIGKGNVRFPDRTAEI